MEDAILAVDLDWQRVHGQYQVTHKVGAVVVLEGAARGRIPKTSRLPVHGHLGKEFDQIDASARWPLATLGDQFVPCLVQLADKLGRLQVPLFNSLVLRVIRLEQVVDGERNGPGQRLLAVEPLRLARGDVDLQDQQADGQGRRSPLDDESAALKDIAQVLGEVKGQAVEGLLGLGCKGVGRDLERMLSTSAAGSCSLSSNLFMASASSFSSPASLTARFRAPVAARNALNWGSRSA